MSEHEWREEFVARLKTRMEYLEMSQTELSNRSKVSQSEISKLINLQSTPKAFTIRKLAFALLIMPSYFIDF